MARAHERRAATFGRDRLAARVADLRVILKETQARCRGRGAAAAAAAAAVSGGGRWGDPYCTILGTDNIEWTHAMVSSGEGGGGYLIT